MPSEPLVCPNCAHTFPLDERFCPDCHMPLVYSGPRTIDAAVDDKHARARKIKPQYAEGDLVRVAGGRNQAEAEFIQGLLLEEGVPSLLRRSRGFDVPDYLAAGPRDVMVPSSGADTARDVLLQARLDPTDAPTAIAGSPARVMAALLAGLALVALIAWLGTDVLAR